MIRKLFIIMVFCGMGGAALGQYQIPLYAPGNTGGESTNTNYSLLSITGQNAIGSTSDANNKVYLGLLAPVRYVITDAEVNQIGGTQLFQNYPNPYKTKTSIPFKISKFSKVKLIVMDILGQQVEILLDQEMPPGSHIIQFDAQNVKPGLYLYHIKIGDYVATKTMVLTK